MKKKNFNRFYYPRLQCFCFVWKNNHALRKYKNFIAIVLNLETDISLHIIKCTFVISLYK